MAMQGTLSGRFVTKRYKKWDAFTDRDGKSVSAGESLSVFVWTPHDDDLCEVKLPPEKIDALLPVVGGFTFGVEVECAVGDKSYGKYAGTSIRAVAEASKPRAVAS